MLNLMILLTSEQLMKFLFKHTWNGNRTMCLWKDRRYLAFRKWESCAGSHPLSLSFSIPRMFSSFLCLDLFFGKVPTGLSKHLHWVARSRTGNTGFYVIAFLGIHRFQSIQKLTRSDWKRTGNLFCRHRWGNNICCFGQKPPSNQKRKTLTWMCDCARCLSHGIVHEGSLHGRVNDQIRETHEKLRFVQLSAKPMTARIESSIEPAESGLASSRRSRLGVRQTQPSRGNSKEDSTGVRNFA